MDQVSSKESDRVNTGLRPDEYQDINIANELGLIFSEHSPIVDVLKQADLASRTNLPVLIIGETGTGKELIARYIHSRSIRREQPMK